MSDETRELNDHDVGAGFDPSICRGTAEGFDSPCPKLNAQASGLGRIAQVVSQAAGQETCGACGCPLATMDMMDAPPKRSMCPRYDAHANSGGR